MVDGGRGVDADRWAGVGSIEGRVWKGRAGEASSSPAAREVAGGTSAAGAGPTGGGPAASGAAGGEASAAGAHSHPGHHTRADAGRHAPCSANAKPNRRGQPTEPASIGANSACREAAEPGGRSSAGRSAAGDEADSA